MDNILDKIYVWSKASVVDELLIFAAIIAAIETYAQNTIKNSDDNSKSLVVGLLLYAIVGYVLHFTYHKFPLSKLNVTWSSISIITATCIGYLLYNESLNAWKIVATTLALGAVYCISKA